MNLALAVLAVLAATPMVRGRIALGPDPRRATRWVAFGGLAGLGGVAALVGSALAAGADISAPTARIAAGFVMSVTAVPDLWRRPVVAGATDPPWRAGLVPVAFPELFGPPLAAALIATTIDLGVATGLTLTVLAVLAAAVVDRLPGGRASDGPPRGAMALRAAAAIAAGIALLMNGVYDI